LEQAQIPTLAEIEKSLEADLESLAQKEIKREPSKSKSRRKEVNYITDFMCTTAEMDATPEPIDENEIVISIGVYHPQRQNKMQEFLVLGSQYLTALRDRIYCINDSIFDGSQIKSGYFFFENVFYDDMRSSNAIRYSESVILFYFI
jgi:snRNA-activating protein complex subunit 3